MDETYGQLEITTNLNAGQAYRKALQFVGVAEPDSRVFYENQDGTDLMDWKEFIDFSKENPDSIEMFSIGTQNYSLNYTAHDEREITVRDLTDYKGFNPERRYLLEKAF